MAAQVSICSACGCFWQRETTQYAQEPLSRGKSNRKFYRLRVRQRISQEYLAKGLRLSYHQIQKYEKGRNRIAGPTKVRLAQTLEVPVSEFFVGIDKVKAGLDPVNSELSCRLKRLK